MIYRMREGPGSATVDVEAALTTQGSIAAPGPITVPTGCTKIKQIIVAIGDNTNSGADGNANYGLRLSGAGIKDTEHTFTIGGSYQIFTTAGTTGFGHRGAVVHNVDIDVNPGSNVAIYCQQFGGVTVGTPEYAVALGFQ